jgi:hypothetical protein
MKFAVLAVLAVVVCGFVIAGLWNWLLPDLIGAHRITFLQALGLLILAKILFGGFHGGRSGHSWRWRRRMMERWEKMTPEEREKFRESFRRCGPWEEPSENENAAKSG